MSNYQPKLVKRPAKPPEEWARIDRSQAIEKWGRMRETTDLHFKFTPKTSAYAILWAALVPLGLLTLIKWDTRRRDLKKGVKPREHF